MKSKTKRILAFLCAVVLVATTVLANSYPKQVEASNDVVPVTLDGFDNLTISDFVGDGWRNEGIVMEAREYVAGEYWGYAASELTNFDKKLVSLNVTFGGGTYANSLMFGGNATWVGFNLHPNSDGSQLVIDETWAGNLIDKSAYTPLTLDAATAGIDSFIGEEFLLQMSFEYGEEVDGKADLTLGMYINGELYNNAEFTIAGCSTSANGARLAIYPQTTNQTIIIGEEVEFPAEPITLDGFDNLTISDFADRDGNPMTAGDYTKGTTYFCANEVPNFDKKLISMYVTFVGGSYRNSIILSGNGTWCGLNIHPNSEGTQLVIDETWAGDLIDKNTYTPLTLDAATAGLDSFIGEEFLLQMSFEYGEEVDGKADLSLGMYINGELYNNATFTIAGCSTSTRGAVMALYRETTDQTIIIGEEVQFPVIDEPATIEPVFPDGYEYITIQDFKDADDTSVALTPGTGTSTGYKRYQATEYTGFDNALLSMKITFAAGTYATRLDVAGGASSGWYSGLWVYPSDAAGTALKVQSCPTDGNGFYGMTDEYQMFEITADEAGVEKFVGEEFILQLAFNFGEEVNGKADLTLDVYINGNLAKSHTFTGCNTDRFGSYLNFVNGVNITYDNVIAPTEPDTPDTPATPDGPVSIDGYENITISDFTGLEPGTLAAGGGYKYYPATDYTSLDNTLLSMNITFGGGSYTTRLDVAGKGWWSGLWLYPSNAAGDELWIVSSGPDANNNYGTTDSRQSFAITPTEAGVDKFVGEEFILQLAFDFGEEVNGKADLTLSVYINGNLCKTHTFTGCNIAKFGNHLTFYSASGYGSSITYGDVIVSDTPDVPVTPQEPVELDGYDNITIKNFEGLEPGILEAGGGYKFYPAMTHDNFDNVVLSTQITFGGGSYTTRLDVAGTGWWSGLWVYPSNAAGDELWIVSSGPDANNNYGTTDSRQSFAITPAEAGVDKFVDEEFILQLAFDFGEVVNGKADLTLSVYINGNLCKTHTFTGCNMDKFGNYLTFYSASGYGGSITYGDVVLSNTPDTPDVPDTPVGTGEPVELDGYDNLTIKNFEGLTPGTCYGSEGNGTYTGGNSAYGHTDFDNVVLSMKLTFTGGSYTTRMEFGSTGQWGFALHPSADGTELQIRNYSKMTNSTALPTMTAAAAGVDSFLNEEFLLQMSFDYGEVVDGRRDVTVGVYINGQLYNNQAFTIADCDATKLGSCLGFYSMVKGANITYDDVILSNTPDVPEGPGDVDLSGYEEVTIKDFVDDSGKVMEEKAYTCPDPTKGIFEGFSLAKHADFNKKVLSMNVMFKAGGYGARIDVAGSEKWKGLMVYPTTTGDQLYVMATTSYCGVDSNQSIVVDATTAGIDSFIDTQFLMQLTFDFSEVVNGKTDLTVGVSINGKLCKSKTFTGCDASAFGNQLGLYRQADDATIIVGSVGAAFPEDPGHQPTGRYKKITFEQFGIADGTYSYVAGNVAVSGTASGRDTLDQTVICGDILYKGSDDSQIIWGGTSAWDGLRMFPKSDGTMLLAWYEGDNATTIATFDSQVAGVQFVGEKYKIMLSSELVDADGDGNVNDIKVGIWFNDVLYNQEYICVKDMGEKYGNYFSVYCASKSDTVTLNSISELVTKKPNANFEKITFQYFGLEDGTYKYDGTDTSTFSGKGIENLDQKVLCGDILLEGNGKISLMVGGKNIWYGLRFITRDDGTILLIWVDEEGTPYIETFDSVTAGTTLIGEWVNLMISTEIVDADGDGAKDDLEFGFWFNGVLYKDKYYTLIDKASGLGKCFGFDCAGEDTSVSVRSIPEFVKGFDYSMYGLTENWKKELLDTGFEVKTEVGKSRNPEPFTGDWIEAGKVLGIFGTAAIVVSAGIWVVLQKRKNQRVS